MNQTGFWLLILIVCGAIWLISTIRTAAKNKKVEANRAEFSQERETLIANGEWDKLLYKLTLFATGIFSSGKIFEVDNFAFLKGLLEDIITYAPKGSVASIDVATLKESLAVLVSVNEGKAKDINKVKEFSEKGTKIVTDAFTALYAKFGEK